MKWIFIFFFFFFLIRYRAKAEPPAIAKEVSITAVFLSMLFIIIFSIQSNLVYKGTKKDVEIIFLLAKINDILYFINTLPNLYKLTVNKQLNLLFLKYPHHFIKKSSLGNISNTWIPQVRV